MGYCRDPMTGRPPKPTKLRLIQGNPGKRPINDAEPVAPPEIPKPPRYLSKPARREWKRAGALLKDAGLLSNLDQVAFGRFCQLVGRLAEAEEGLAAHGMLVKSPNGYPMQSPYLSIINTTSKQLVALCAEFGMTPSARSRIRVDNSKPNDEFEEFLNSGKPGKTPSR